MEFKHAKTKEIIDWFEQINRIPRCSKNEKAICEWLQGWAEKHGFKARTDKVMNLVIEVPASKGHENAPACVLQGHLDMVCEKTKDSKHDFTKDPIKPVFADGWMKADKTTLGADNGIAMAMAMALALSKDTPHPPLELLFTVDEETGLTGATALEKGFIQGKLLLNIDSEDEGVFTVGCAGGKDLHAILPIHPAAAPAGHAAHKVVAGGMRGGHSGVDIHEQRANAMQVLTRALDAIAATTDLRLGSFSGGTAHNAIPRDAEALVYLPKGAEAAAAEILDELDGKLKAECQKTDPNVSVKLEPAGGEAPDALGAEETRKALDFFLAFPHGVAEYSKDIAGLVETSNNFAQVKTGKSSIEVVSSQRSSNMDKLDLLTSKIAAVSRLAGAKVEIGGGYPAWKPNMDSKLLAQCKEVYKKLFGKDPVVEIIHAGLECGIIGAKYDGMDMISFGPTIKNPHSPDEKIQVESIGQVWDFMAALLKSLE
jgi:dipeptidase D